MEHNLTDATQREIPQDMQIALGLVSELNAAGFETYLVGGCVRDFVLGRTPHDFDLTTAATPEELKTLYPEAKLVGAHFGVNLVPYLGHKFEVATFRTDGCYSDARRPDEVRFTKNVLEDLERRDFTCNTLLMNADGKVLDYFQGLVDLRRGVLRAVGDPAKRFTEDALRMLRAVRFASKLNLRLAIQTNYDLKKLAHTITKLSPERISEELTKLLTSGRAEEAIEMLRRTGLLDSVLPELLPMIGCTQNPEWHPEGDVYVHTLGLLRNLPVGCSPTLAWAALLHDTGKPGTAVPKEGGYNSFHGHEELSAKIADAILQRLKFSTEDRETIVKLCANHMRFMSVTEMRRSTLLRFIGQPNFPELLELHKLDARAGRSNMEHADFVEKVLASTPEHVLHPVKLITGDDLYKMGLTPGPIYRTLLDLVATAHLEGEISDREGALKLVARELVKTPAQ